MWPWIQGFGMYLTDTLPPVLMYLTDTLPPRFDVPNRYTIYM